MWPIFPVVYMLASLPKCLLTCFRACLPTYFLPNSIPSCLTFYLFEGSTNFTVCLSVLWPTYLFVLICLPAPQIPYTCFPSFPTSLFTCLQPHCHLPPPASSLVCLNHNQRDTLLAWLASHLPVSLSSLTFLLRPCPLFSDSVSLLSCRFA